MAQAQRTRVQVKPRRDLHKPEEWFGEIHHPELGGCLICIRRAPVGGVTPGGDRLVIEAYSADPAVHVRINGRDFKAPR